LFQASLGYAGVTLKRRLHKFNIQALDSRGACSRLLRLHAPLESNALHVIPISDV
jgi:hypothetical protein